MTLANYLWGALVGASLTATPPISSAQTHANTGVALLSRLNTVDGPNPGLGTGLGVGYVSGVSDTLRVAELVCYPQGVTVNQTVKVVHKYLKDNPAQLHQDTVLLVSAALVEAFPCKDKP